MGSWFPEWITDRLSIYVPPMQTPEEVTRYLSNGYLFVEILRKFSIFSDDQLVGLHHDYGEKTKLRNMTYLYKWTNRVGIGVHSRELSDIQNEVPGAGVKFLYKLYRILEATKHDCEGSDRICKKLMKLYECNKSQDSFACEPQPDSEKSDNDDDCEKAVNEEGAGEYKSDEDDECYSYFSEDEDDSDDDAVYEKLLRKSDNSMETICIAVEDPPKKADEGQDEDEEMCGEDLSPEACLEEVNKKKEERLRKELEGGKEDESNECEGRRLRIEGEGEDSDEEDVPISITHYPMKPENTGAARVYFASEAARIIADAKFCLLEKACEVDQKLDCPEECDDEPLDPPPPCPPTSRWENKQKKKLEEQRKQRESAMSSLILDDMNKFDAMVVAEEEDEFISKKFKSPSRMEELRSKCFRPVEFEELEEERAFFQAVFGKRKKKLPNKKGIVTIGLEGGGQCWTTYDIEARQIAQQILGWTFDLAMKVAEWKESSGVEPPEKLYKQWKSVIFHIPPMELGYILHQAMEPFQETCRRPADPDEGEEADDEEEEYYEKYYEKPAPYEEEEYYEMSAIDEEEFVHRHFFNLHEEYTMEKILAEERKLLRMQSEAEKELHVLADMSSYERAMSDYSEWLKRKENDALMERLRCFRRSADGSEEVSNEASFTELGHPTEQRVGSPEEESICGPPIQYMIPDEDLLPAESSSANKSFIRNVVSWGAELAMRIADFQRETEMDPPHERICWWKCGLWRSLMDTGKFKAWEDQEAALNDQWLLQEDFVCGSYAGKIKDCNLKQVLEDEKIIKKLKDRVEIDYRLGKELDAYDEMVMDPDYLEVLASRAKMRREEQNKKCPLGGGGPLASSNPPSEISRGKNLRAFKSRLKAIKESRAAEASLQEKKERLRSSICARLIEIPPSIVYDNLLCTATKATLRLWKREKFLAQYFKAFQKEKKLFYSQRRLEEEGIRTAGLNLVSREALSQIHEMDVCRDLAHLSASHSKHVQYEVRKAQWEIMRAESTAMALSFLDFVIELTFRVQRYKRKKGKYPPQEMMEIWKNLFQLEDGKAQLDTVVVLESDAEDEEEEEMEAPMIVHPSPETLLSSGGTEGSLEASSGSGEKAKMTVPKKGKKERISVGSKSAKAEKISKKGKGNKVKAPPNSANK